MKPVHAARLDRWLGAEATERLSTSHRDWYGPPIALAGIPGRVYVTPGGDFVGTLRAGEFYSAADRLNDIGLRLKMAMRRASIAQASQLNTGFASLTTLLAALRNGDTQTVPYNKIAASSVADSCRSEWYLDGQPGIGATPSGAPGGDATTNSTAGALALDPAPSGKTQHLLSWEHSMGTGVGTGFSWLLYDRLFQVAKTMNSNATESVTGVPTRYQSNTQGDENFAGGNFLIPEVRTTLASGAHNHDTILYRNQAGTDAQTAPSIAGISACVANRIDLPTFRWFMPLAAGDTGIADLHQIQYSTNLIATGTLNYVIGHPIAWMPTPISFAVCSIDCITTAFSLARIFDNACLALMCVWVGSAQTASPGGFIRTVMG